MEKGEKMKTKFEESTNLSKHFNLSGIYSEDENEILYF